MLLHNSKDIFKGELLNAHKTCCSKIKKYDDVANKDDICKKKFPEVSYGGFGYIFFWICPIHGHYYGFISYQVDKGGKAPFHSCVHCELCTRFF